jgi:hypothetical protein
MPFQALGFKGNRFTTISIDIRLSNRPLPTPLAPQLSNEQIIRLYILGYAALANLTKESTWEYKKAKTEMNKLLVELGGKKRSDLGEWKAEFLAHCREEQYQPWLGELVAAFGVPE